MTPRHLPTFNIFIDDGTCRDVSEITKSLTSQNYPESHIRIHDGISRKHLYKCLLDNNDSSDNCDRLEWIIMMDSNVRFTDCNSLHTIAMYIINHGYCDDMIYNWKYYTGHYESINSNIIKQECRNSIVFCASHIDMFQFSKCGKICDTTLCFQLLICIHIDKILTYRQCEKSIEYVSEQRAISCKESMPNNYYPVPINGISLAHHQTIIYDDCNTQCHKEYPVPINGISRAHLRAIVYDDCNTPCHEKQDEEEIKLKYRYGARRLFVDRVYV